MESKPSKKENPMCRKTFSSWEETLAGCAKTLQKLVCLHGTKGSNSHPDYLNKQCLLLQSTWHSKLFNYTLRRILPYKHGLYHNLLLNLFVVQYSWINNILSESDRLLEAMHLPLHFCKIHNMSTEHVFKANVTLVKREDFQYSLTL